MDFTIKSRYGKVVINKPVFLAYRIPMVHYPSVSSVQEIGPFSLFQNLALGKDSPDVKCHFAIVSLLQNLNLGKNSTNLKCHLTISWGTSCQYQCLCKISSQYSAQFKR